MAVLTAGTADFIRDFTPVKGGTTPDLLAVFEVRSQATEPEDTWVPEEAVLEVPEVQDAIRFAVQDFEEWKNSL